MAASYAMHEMTKYLKAENDKKNFEKLKQLGESKENLSKGITEAKKYVHKDIAKILDENKSDIEKNTYSEKIKKMNPAVLHRSKPPVTKPSADKKEAALDKFLEAFKNVCWDILTLVMGLLGLGSAVTISKKAFLSALQTKSLKPMLKLDNLLVRLQSMAKNPTTFFKELTTFVTEWRGFQSAFSDILSAFFDAVTSDFWQTLKVVVLFFAQIIVWTTTGGAALVASIVLNAAAIGDLIAHIGDAATTLAAYNKIK